MSHNVRLAVRHDSSLYIGKGAPPSPAKCKWRWTDAMVSSIPQLWNTPEAIAANHGFDEDLVKLVSQILAVDASRIRIYQRQPIIVTGRQHDRIFVLDTKPSTNERTILSIVVSTDHIDTRHYGCDEQIKEVFSRLLGHESQLRATETTAYLVSAILKVPIWDIVGRLEYLEEQAVRIEHAVRPGMAVGISKCRRKVSELRVELSGYRKLLTAYERVCGTLMDEHSGAFSHGVPAGTKEVQEFIGGLRLSVEAGSANAQQLREALGEIESLLSFEQTDRTNKLLSWMSLVLLPASLAAALLSMNVDLPGETGGFLHDLRTTVDSLKEFRLSEVMGHLRRGGGGFAAGLIFCFLAIPFSIGLFVSLRWCVILGDRIWEIIESWLAHLFERSLFLKRFAGNVPFLRTIMMAPHHSHSNKRRSS